MLTQTDDTPVDRHSDNRTQGYTRVDRLARRAVLRTLADMTSGHLVIADQDGQYSFGSQAPAISIQVHAPRFYRRICIGGTVAAGEAFADGDWTCNDLTGLIELFVQNREQLNRVDSGLRYLRFLFDRIEHLGNANTLTGSRRNIAAHYDLSNDFFKTFLDSRLMYSSAMFPRHKPADSVSLDEASQEKLRAVCQKLSLGPRDHVLEIGTGWGGFAIYAASNYRCRVTTTTISEAQFAEASARVEAAGLSDLVTVLLKDYRALNEPTEGNEPGYDFKIRFTKIVSIEMVEAVGDDFVDSYFQICDELLVPGGQFLVQAITMQDQHYEAALREVDFIKKHIFPGAFLPSITRLTTAARHTTALKLTHLEDIGLDYAETIKRWRQNFVTAEKQLSALGFDERFQRLWLFYFHYCEGGFRTQFISDVQMIFHKCGPQTVPWR